MSRNPETLVTPLPLARDLAVAVRPVHPETLCAPVFERLIAVPQLLHIPVVKENGEVAGLVLRHKFMLPYTKPFGRELYGQRPVSRLMERDPLIVQGSLTCEEINVRYLARQNNLPDMQGFVVVEKGRYAGVITVSALLAVMAGVMQARAQQLEVQMRRAEEASLSKTRFLANMSHELRTPLNAIIGFAELMDRQIFGAIQPTQYREYIGDIHDSGKHLLSVINDILDMAKIESGKFELEDNIFDPLGLVHEVLRMLKKDMEKRKQTFHFTTVPQNGEMPMIRADERYFRQILINLLSNAVKFTPDGGSIRFSTGLEPDGSMKMEIHDSGVGIPQEKIARVFEPFEQLENPFTRGISGTGLGLPLTRAMIEAHGGSIAMSSEEGAGTCISFSLPPDRLVVRSRILSPAVASPPLPSSVIVKNGKHVS